MKVLSEKKPEPSCRLQKSFRHLKRDEITKVCGCFAFSCSLGQFVYNFISRVAAVSINMVCLEREVESLLRKVDKVSDRPA